MIAGRPLRSFWNRSPRHVFHSADQRSEARVKTQLQELRTMAEVRLRSGTVPDWSWQQHIQLIEAVDAVLHDLSMVEAMPQAKRHAGSALRLVTDNPERPGERRKIRSLR
jgi:hypothetical protein